MVLTCGCFYLGLRLCPRTPKLRPCRNRFHSIHHGGEGTLTGFTVHLLALPWTEDGLAVQTSLVMLHFVCSCCWVCAVSHRAGQTRTLQPGPATLVSSPDTRTHPTGRPAWTGLWTPPARKRAPFAGDPDSRQCLHFLQPPCSRWADVPWTDVARAHSRPQGQLLLGQNTF